jgi:hypothetical protein
MASLHALFWHHVDRHVGSESGKRRTLKRDLLRIRYRNKNTFTNWLTKPVPERPDVSLSDLEDMAVALGVDPASLISPDKPDEPATWFQLELPFDTESHRVAFELEATSSILRIRVARPGR